MSFWKIGFVLFGLLLVGCNVNDSAGPRMDVTLEPSSIAQYEFREADMPAESAEPVTVILAPRPGVLEPTSAPQATESTAPNAAPTNDPVSAVPTPTSNAAEIQAITDNPTLAVTMEMDTTCFLANDFIPFRLNVTSLETAPIYFYRNGRWRLSINNSPLGPELSSLGPTIRDDFVELQPGGTFVQEEEDLGLWALSLGPNAGVPSSPSGLGLPAGNYWVTFVYDNDQDGLREQPDGTFLIDRAAWRGTVVAPEMRFSVVEDITEC
jgi:hypothetical protein